MSGVGRHAVYSGLNKPRLLLGVDYRIFLLAGASGLPILAFFHSRLAFLAAFVLPLLVFIAGAAAYRRDPHFVEVWRVSARLRKSYDASKRAPQRRKFHAD